MIQKIPFQDQSQNVNRLVYRTQRLMRIYDVILRDNLRHSAGPFKTNFDSLRSTKELNTEIGKFISKVYQEQNKKQAIAAQRALHVITSFEEDNLLTNDINGGQTIKISTIQQIRIAEAKQISTDFLNQISQMVFWSKDWQEMKQNMLKAREEISREEWKVKMNTAMEQVKRSGGSQLKKSIDAHFESLQALNSLTRTIVETLSQMLHNKQIRLIKGTLRYLEHDSMYNNMATQNHQKLGHIFYSKEIQKYLEQPCQRHTNISIVKLRAIFFTFVTKLLEQKNTKEWLQGIRNTLQEEAQELIRHSDDPTGYVFHHFQYLINKTRQFDGSFIKNQNLKTIVNLLEHFQKLKRTKIFKTTEEQDKVLDSIKYFLQKNSDFLNLNHSKDTLNFLLRSFNFYVSKQKLKELTIPSTFLTRYNKNIKIMVQNSLIKQSQNQNFQSLVQQQFKEFTYDRKNQLLTFSIDNIEVFKMTINKFITDPKIKINTQTVYFLRQVYKSISELGQEVDMKVERDINKQQLIKSLFFTELQNYLIYNDSKFSNQFKFVDSEARSTFQRISEQLREFAKKLRLEREKRYKQRMGPT